MIRVGLPKGSVKHRSIQLISNLVNLPIDPSRLRHSDHHTWSLYLLKHRDIPLLVKDGILDIGITSTEWIVERAPKLAVVRTLNWCNARISLVGVETLETQLARRSSIRCVTEYPRVARAFFHQKGLGAITDLTVLSGSSEALVPDRFDFAAECVETGATLAANDLKELEVILPSSVVICISPDKERQLTSTIEAIYHNAQRAFEPREAADSRTNQDNVGATATARACLPLRR